MHKAQAAIATFASCFFAVQRSAQLVPVAIFEKCSPKGAPNTVVGMPLSMVTRSPGGDSVISNSVEEGLLSERIVVTEAQPSGQVLSPMMSATQRIKATKTGRFGSTGPYLCARVGNPICSKQPQQWSLVVSGYRL
jgi:hypothetical protein